MLAKILLGLFACGAVIASPYIHNKYNINEYAPLAYGSGERYHGPYYGKDYYGQDVYHDVFAKTGSPGHDFGGFELDREGLYAKEIICPAYYKIVYTTIPAQCHCDTKTEYVKPHAFDMKDVKFNKEYHVPY
ncbi:hypothetical protein SeLEV6574_g03932 [Synchytrium endobioticum]|uniref:Uncharacterized protein n=1 Tax=Synchytrium endobioticum TaxID=286115 RepID=A0A507D1S2_9FUNG|nr:hypothetical protein SeLEV6574_g03932 [Synchytrium endobioticum]